MKSRGALDASKEQLAEWGRMPPRGGSTPSKFTPELLEQIIQKIESGQTLTSIAKELDFSFGSFMRQTLKNPALGEQYRRARRFQAHSLVDSAMDAAGTAEDKDSGYAARVKAEAYLKGAGKWSPDEFSDRPAPMGAVSIEIHTTLGLAVGHQVAEQGYSIEVEPEPQALIDDSNPGDVLADLRSELAAARKSKVETLEITE